MIYGIGHDVLDMKRMEMLMTGPHGERFMQRVLTQGEQVIAAGKGRNARSLLPGAFFAKEAISKAFGSGIGGVIGFRDIEVLPGALGRPEARLSRKPGTALEWRSPPIMRFI